MDCKIITIVNEKGGVSKTATATTLAYLLSKRGYRTALIDFDDQGHSSIWPLLCGGHHKTAADCRPHGI